jgi:hypothetical protein
MREKSLTLLLLLDVFIASIFTTQIVNGASTDTLHHRRRGGYPIRSIVLVGARLFRSVAAIIGMTAGRST